MNATEQQLWKKIKNFQLDKEGISLSFSKRLARENGFSEQFAKEIVEEYKKFIFMCCISEQPVTPSNYVDLAWHLHLTYTKSYWIGLCQNTMQREIHHTPTEGGKSERSKFKNCYEYTLDFYEKIFKQKPNPEIWENTQKRFELNFINVDKTENWIIPKLKFSANTFLGVTFGSLFLISCSSNNATLPFVVFIGFVFIAIISKLSQTHNNRDSRNHQDSGGLGSGCSTGSGDSHSHDGETDGNEGDGGDSSDGGGDSGCSGCGGCGGGGD
jgi:hypothetical protein